MTALNHALTGAAIGLTIQNPYLVIPLAFVSHFVLDAMPHFGHKVYEYGSKHAATLYIADGIATALALIALFLFAPHLLMPVLLGAFFAILPDAFWLHYYQNGRPQTWFYRFHQKIQWFERPPGLLVEASYLIFICTAISASLLT